MSISTTTTSSSTTTIASPLQWKEFLGQMKTNLLGTPQKSDDDDDDHSVVITTQITTNYYALLCLELLQRGMIVNQYQIMDVNINTKQTTKTKTKPELTGAAASQATEVGKMLLQSVTNIAGKILLTSTSTGSSSSKQHNQNHKIPNPLLAGSAVLAAKMTEQLYQFLLMIQKQQRMQHEQQLQQQSPTNSQQNQKMKNQSFETMFPDRKELQNTIERCQTVQDDRLRILLQLSLFLLPINTNNSSNNINVQDHHGRIDLLLYHLLHIMDGYYYRALSFYHTTPTTNNNNNNNNNPNTTISATASAATTTTIEVPPMIYKRIWEISLEKVKIMNRNTVTTITPWLASYPIEQLLQNAVRKKNEKRILELSLRLIESYLDHALTHSTTTTSTTTTNSYEQHETKEIEKVFLVPYRPFQSSPLQPMEAFNKVFVLFKQLENNIVSNLLLLLEQTNDSSSSATTTTTMCTTTPIPTYQKINSLVDQYDYCILQVRLYLLYEFILIENETQSIYQHEQNRRRQQEQQLPTTTTKTKTSTTTQKMGRTSTVVTTTIRTMDEIRNKCRQQYYQKIGTNTNSSSSTDDDTEETKNSEKNHPHDNNNQLLDTSIQQLRDVLFPLQKKKKSSCVSKDKNRCDSTTIGTELIQELSHRAYELLDQYVSRYQEIIQGTLGSKTKTKIKEATTSTNESLGYQFATFLYPILEYYQEQFIIGKEKEKESSITTATTTTTITPLNMNATTSVDADVDATKATATPNTTNMDHFIAMRSDVEIHLIETVCYQILSLEWIFYISSSSSSSYLNHGMNNTTAQQQGSFLSYNILLFLDQMLSTLLRKRIKEQQRTENNRQKLNTIGSVSVQEKIQVRIQYKLECALSTTQALLILYQTKGVVDDDDDDDDTMSTDFMNQRIQSMNDGAVSRFEKWDTSYQELSGELGYPYLEFVLCWSGFHRYPWPYCRTRYDAREICTKAQQCLKETEQKWGQQRSFNLNENYAIVTIGLADAEGYTFSGSGGGGGLNVTLSYQLYTQTLDSIQTEGWVDHPVVEKKLLEVLCQSGISKTIQNDPTLRTRERELQPFGSYALLSLDILQSLHDQSHIQPIFLWKDYKYYYQSMMRFQMGTARQLIADSLLQQGDTVGARQFLQDAVRDNPGDAQISFALGVLLLYIAFFNGDEQNSENKKQAQIQLLKTAKLDSTQASPFALLGYWYEDQNDKQRALGCYNKALQLDPSHPVAGRGICRLVSSKSDTFSIILDRAINNTTSSLNGWAWYAMGKQKSYRDGNDELAAVSFLKALRCRDVAQEEQSETLSAFYGKPSSSSHVPKRYEVARILVDIAQCYRRLGRYTSAIRSYHNAIQEYGDHADATVLCACAEVESELGLYEDAEMKFFRAMNLSTGSMLVLAVYGRGVALMSMSKRELDTGKAGLAYSLLLQAIRGCDVLLLDDGSTKHYICIHKLLGDLYTQCAHLPPDLFGVSTNTMCDNVFITHKEQVRAQIGFVVHGEMSYREAEKLIRLSSLDEESKKHVEAVIIADIGANLLLQAQLSTSLHGAALLQGTATDPRLEVISKIHKQAAYEYRRALDVDPDCVTAWCGLGCALIDSDPLLAQHSFCRCIELDPLFPDPYANLSFLYTKYNSITASEHVLDALTEVADTPLMWINRAYLLEKKKKQQQKFGTTTNTPNRECSENVFNDLQQQAADAYRTALQVGPHPAALLGVAMTSPRILGMEANKSNIEEPPFSAASTTKVSASGSSSKPKVMTQESYYHLTEYLNSTGCVNVRSVLYSGVLMIEHSLWNSGKENEAILQDGVMKAGRQLIRNGLEEMKSNNETSDKNNSTIIELFQNIVDATNVSQMNTDHPILAVGNDEGDLKQQVVLHPHRGDLWVKLAKQIVLNHVLNHDNKIHQTESDNCPNESSSSFHLAYDAVNRGITILMQQLTNPRSLSSLKQKQHHQNKVRADNLADAYALRFWIENCGDVTVARTAANTGTSAALMEKDTVHDNVDNENTTAPNITTTKNNNNTRRNHNALDLQRSLLLNPGNIMARGAIQALQPNS